MSVVTMRAIEKKPKEESRMRQDKRAAFLLNHFRAKKYRNRTVRKAKVAFANLKDHSLTPNSLYEIATAQ